MKLVWRILILGGMEAAIIAGFWAAFLWALRLEDTSWALPLVFAALLAVLLIAATWYGLYLAEKSYSTRILHSSRRRQTFRQYRMVRGGIKLMPCLLCAFSYPIAASFMR